MKEPDRSAATSAQVFVLSKTLSTSSSSIRPLYILLSRLPDLRPRYTRRRIIYRAEKDEGEICCYATDTAASLILGVDIARLSLSLSVYTSRKIAWKTEGVRQKTRQSFPIFYSRHSIAARETSQQGGRRGSTLLHDPRSLFALVLGLTNSTPSLFRHYTDTARMQRV